MKKNHNYKNRITISSILICGMLLLSACGKEVSQSGDSAGDTKETAASVTEDGYNGDEHGEDMQDASEDGMTGNVKQSESSDAWNGTNSENGTDDVDRGPLHYNTETEAATDLSFASADASAFMQPILQNPEETSVTVQWFTEEEGDKSFVCLYGDASDPDKVTDKIDAVTFQMTRLRGGKTEADMNNASTDACIYKHVAVVKDLPEYHGYDSERVAYSIVTDDRKSDRYTLAAAPAAGTPLRILLTSDLQIKNMCAANFQKVYETIGNVDGIFCDGDLADVTDRAYDWFYTDNAFWKVMTGTACDEVGDGTYYGAPLVQSAPIYTAIGNHDVMGVYDETTDLSVQFNNPSTRENAEQKWNSLSAEDKAGRDEDDYIRDNSFNTISYEEMFELPQSTEGGEKYYSVSFGDVRLITLDLSRIWRLTAVGGLGKYSEVPGEKEENYGYGEFIFEPIKEGSDQYEFLKNELEKPEYKNAEYRMVMFHSEAHSLGDNQVPAFTDPVAKTVTDPVSGLNMTIYDYPIEKDYISSLVEPMLTAAGTNLLFEAHSHLWNRFVTESGMNVLETSNVGNTYGAYTGDGARSTLPSAFKSDDPYSQVSDAWEKENYYSSGDPYGLEPVSPTETELPDGKPYLDSNTITAFSILDTKKGTVDSYYFDTGDPDSEVVLFDSFTIAN